MKKQFLKSILISALIIALTLALAGCNFFRFGRPSTAKLDTPELSLSGNYIMWTAQDEAEYYLVRIYAAGDDVPLTWKSKSGSFALSNLAGGEYSLTVQGYAKKDSGLKNSDVSDAIAVSVITPIAGIDKVAFYLHPNGTHTVVAWDYVEGAERYKLKTNGGGYVSVRNNYAIPASEYVHGTIQIEVISKAGYATLEPKDVVVVEPSITMSTITYDVAAPSTVELDAGTYRVDGKYETISTPLSAQYLSDLGYGAHLFERYDETGFLAATSIKITDSRPPVLTNVGGDVVTTLAYEMDDVFPALVLNQYHASHFESEHFDLSENGNVTIKESVKAGLTDGLHNLSIAYKDYTDADSTLTIAVTVSSAQMEINEAEYTYFGSDLEVDVTTHGDRVAFIRVMGVPLFSYDFVSGANTLRIKKAYLETLVGTTTFTVTTLKGATFTFDLIKTGSGVAVAGGLIEYDKADGGDLIVPSMVYSHDVILLGAHIGPGDYLIQPGENGIRLKAAYLSRQTGVIQLVARASSAQDAPFAVHIKNTAAKPYDIYLDAESRTNPYLTFSCDCGENSHACTIDGVSITAEAPITDGSFAPFASHDIKVRCLTSNKETSFHLDGYTVSSYMTRTGTIGGEKLDFFVANQREFNKMVEYLTYRGAELGDMSDANSITETMYFSNEFVNEIDGYENSSMFIRYAMDSFETPCTISISVGGTVHERNVTITFGGTLLRNATTGTVHTPTKDVSSYLATNNKTWSSAPTTKTQEVNSVAELMALPMGVRPTFNSSAGSVMAREAYVEASDFCFFHIDNEMTDAEKVAVFYHYLTGEVTYDRLASDVLYGLYIESHSGVNISALRSKVFGYLSEYSTNGTLCALLNTLMPCTTVEEFQIKANAITSSLSVFNAYGALVNHVAVCEGISEAMQLLCKINGIPCIKVAGIGITNTGAENHAWNKVFLDGVWYTIDATWGRSQFSEGAYINHSYFLIPDTKLAKNHLEGAQSISDYPDIAVIATGSFDYFANTKIGALDLVATNKAELTEILNLAKASGRASIEVRLDYHVSSIATQIDVTGQYSYNDGILLFFFK